MAEGKAKRHAVLEALKTDLSRGFLEKTVTVNKFKFVLSTLNEDDEVWADSFVRTSSTMSIVTSVRVPRLACSIKSVNEIPADKLFEYPEDMPKEVQQELDKSDVRKKYWVHTQMMLFLSESGIRPFVNDLYKEYETLESQRNEALKEIPN
jgi:hypothetical protein